MLIAAYVSSYGNGRGDMFCRQYKRPAAGATGALLKASRLFLGEINVMARINENKRKRLRHRGMAGSNSSSPPAW